MKRILLIEDEDGLVLTLTDRLTSEGYQVEAATDGDTGLARGLAGNFDLILLDIMLPGRSGFDVCRRLRQSGIATPILMLTARGGVVDKVEGLQIGADDYMGKPFEMAELLARIEALLRRALAWAKPASETFHFGPVTLNFTKTEVLKDGQPVVLSAREFQLLRYLIENRGKTLTREELLEKVWGYDASLFTRTVDVHMAWLRQKLELNPRAPQYLLTIRGVGYKFAEAC
ncbi:MAG: DNA-binding response regulator [Acidobacteriia bacterium]|nr:DNA-binding response regulator [Terriglobia bacterium]